MRGIISLPRLVDPKVPGMNNLNNLRINPGMLRAFYNIVFDRNSRNNMHKIMIITIKHKVSILTINVNVKITHIIIDSISSIISKDHILYSFTHIVRRFRFL